MQPSSSTAIPTVPSAADNAPRVRRVEDVIYQAVTVGAILLILGSLWIF